MINPDAVAVGNCCVSTSGINFGKDLGSENAKGIDGAAKKLTEYFLTLKPEFFLDIHNNSGPHLVDSFYSNDCGLLRRFAAVAPDMSHHQKIWAINRKEFGSTRPMENAMNNLEQLISLRNFLGIQGFPMRWKRREQHFSMLF